MTEPITVTFVLTTPDAVGGTERATFQLVSHLAGCSELRASILGLFRDADSPWFSTDLDPDVPLRYLIDRRGGDDPGEPSAIVDQAWEPSISQRADRALADALHRAQPDVVVATTPALLALLVELAPDRTKVVGVEHRATMTRGVTGEPIRRYGPRADALVSLTEAGTTWYGDTFGPSAPPLATIPNMLPERFVPRSSLTRPLVVAAGRLVGAKQFEHALEAFARAHRPGWRLRIFGDGPRRNRLHGLAIRHGIHDHVELVPSVPAIEHELAKASMLVISSRAEGQPLVALEALAAGVPIVAYDCPTGPRSIIEHGVNGFLARPNDPDDLAGYLARLMDDEALLRRLGAGALESSRRFGPPGVVDAWRRLLGRVAASSPRRLAPIVAAEPVPAAPARHPLDGNAAEPWVPRGGLLIHIGPHKTGTTAIQSAFAAARSELADVGVVYPGLRPAPHGAVMNRLRTPRGWDDAIAPGSLDAWDQLCVETRAARGTVVVSSEALCHADAATAAGLGHEIRPGPVRVVVTLRALEEIIPSSWQEYVKSGWTTEFDEFLAAVLDPAAEGPDPTPTFWQRQDHGALVERWAEAVGAGNVAVVVTDARRPDDLYRAFTAMLGLPPGLLRSGTGASNRSLGAAETEWLRRVNELAKGSVEWERFNQVLRQGGTTALVERRARGTDDPVPVVPAWAVDRAREAGARAIERIRATGVAVVGDLDRLVPTDLVLDRAVPDRPDRVSVDAVATLVVGMVEKWARMAPVHERPPPSALRS